MESDPVTHYAHQRQVLPSTREIIFLVPLEVDTVDLPPTFVVTWGQTNWLGVEMFGIEGIGREAACCCSASRC